jgi:hypothetical protein
MIILPCNDLVVCFIRVIPKSPEAVQALCMRAGIVVNVTRADRRRLEAIISNRGHPIIEGYDPPEGRDWCYVDEVFLA